MNSPTDSPHYDSRTRSAVADFAWFAVIYHVAVILWGAYVRASRSGAGCGNHWPLCNGTILPVAPQLETIIEFTHRVTSGLAVLIVLTLVVWCWRKTSKGAWARYSAIGSLVFLLNEAVLGALLVAIDATGQGASAQRVLVLCVHFGNTLLLLAALTLTAEGLSEGNAPWAIRKDLRAAALSLVAIMIVGMTGALAALGDTLFPAASLRISMLQDFSSAGNALQHLRFVHPVAALVGGSYVLWFLVRCGDKSGDAKLSQVLVSILITQAALGALNVLLLAPVWLQILHLFVAELLWIGVVLLSSRLIFTQRARAGEPG
jgi:cytochrome c oxidase assembly protein subunit 15